MQQTLLNMWPRNPLDLVTPVLYCALFGIIGLIISLADNDGLFWLIHDLVHKSIAFDVLMKFCAQYLFAVILVAAFGLLIYQQRAAVWVGLGTFVVISIISYLLAKIGGHFIIDIRPYMQYHLVPLIGVAKDNGFPSDHTLISFIAAMTIALFRNKWSWLLCILALVVGIARVFVSAHHPLDIAGSMVIVGVATILTWWFVRFASKVTLRS